jgi:hypothetical protein
MRVSLMGALFLAAAAPAAAQVKTQLQGGPLTLENGAGIVVEEEVVTISRELVTAAYRFRNTTDRDVETVVSFLLRIPANSDGSAEAEENPPPKDWQPSNDWPQASGFQPMVDGKPRAFKTLWRGVGQEAEVRHFWQQRFPAGATVTVEHRYFPGGGAIGPQGPADEGWGALKRDYCVGPTLVAAAGTDAGLTYITHRLKAPPAAPIGRLRVVLKKTKPTERVSLCLDGFEKKSPTTFELERKNFTPDFDLRLIFLDLPSRLDRKVNGTH